MKIVRSLFPLVGVASLAGCASQASTAPIAVAVPGMPNPELALQKSLDRIHGLLTSLNERIDTPARQSIALAQTRTQPMPITPVVQAAPRSVEQPAPMQSAPVSREATPLYGRGGFVWFAFGDGYATIHCAIKDLCMVRLGRGETMDARALSIEKSSGWIVDLVRGTRGIHAGWAIAISPTGGAKASVLRFTTNQRAYVLALDPSGPTMRNVAFTYSKDDPQTQPDPPSKTLLSSVDHSIGPDFSYQITGPDVPFRPMRVYREGGHTYIQFPPGGINAAPRFVLLAPAGDATQAYRVVGDSYVVDRPVDDAMLIGGGENAPVIRIKHGGKA